MQVSWRVYWAYLRAAGPLPFLAGLVAFAGFRAFSVWANFWLSRWTEDPRLTNTTQWGSQAFMDTNRTYLTYYGLMGLTQCEQCYQA